MVTGLVAGVEVKSEVSIQFMLKADVLVSESVLVCCCWGISLDNVWQAGGGDRGGQADKQLHLSDPTRPLVKYPTQRFGTNILGPAILWQHLKFPRLVLRRCRTSLPLVLLAGGRLGVQSARGHWGNNIWG